LPIAYASDPSSRNHGRTGKLLVLVLVVVLVLEEAVPRSGLRNNRETNLDPELIADGATKYALQDEDDDD
jgi:hypothetical protein